MSPDRRNRERGRTSTGYSTVVIVGVIVIVGALAAIFIYHRSYPPKLPGGESPITKAPLGTEKPESAKPPAQRQSG
jgi:hypothetical protein